jgi:PAS domain S-box-containing protein
VILSWLSVNYLFLASRASTNLFESTGQIAFGFVAVGLVITVFGGSLRAARERAKAASFELRRAFEAQKAEREWLQITMASIADAVITTDPNGLVISLNPVAVRLTSWSLDEAVGRPLKEVFRTVQETSWRTDDLPIAKVVGDGEVVLSDDEVVLIARDGTARSVEHNAAPIRDSQGKVKGVVIIFRDITERHRAEQAQRESEQRFRTLADATPIMIWSSGTDKLCNYFNKQWLDFTGRTIEQEMGNGWSEGVHCDDRKRCLDSYVTAFDARKPFLTEYRLRQHDGEYRWVMDTGVPRCAPDGTFSGYIGSCLDITERKRAEEKLRDADRRKEEFLAVLSHELRNPLAPIQTALDLLEQAGASGDSFRRELAMIKRQVQNLRRLVDDLLDVSRISRGKIELRREVIPFTEVIAHSVEAVRPLVDEQHQELHVSIPEESLLLEADPTRLEQILSNLLINAAKYTPHGGKIWLTAERSLGEVVIRIRDTGIGIEPDLLPKVFDLFLQGGRKAGRSHEGGGIGLSLARNLVELHGGTIMAHSQGLDMGSEFVVQLPVISTAQAERKQSSQAIQPELSESLPRRRILIVDDNVQAADSLGMLLSAFLGQEVRVAYCGKSALEMAGSFVPQVILLDLEMAEMDGYEVAMRLREHSECSEALIVAVTGWGHEEYRRRSRETGFDLHLVKPVTAKDLRALLAALKPKLEEPCLCELVPELAHRSTAGSV